MTTTLKVCEVSDVPLREMRCVTLKDRNLLVAHTESGVFVSDEMCTHEDAKLCNGNLTGTLVKCPLHGSRFDLVDCAGSSVTNFSQPQSPGQGEKTQT